MDESERMLADQNELARAVGYALNSWSLLENNLTLLFQTLAEMKEERKAHVVMASIVSFDARMRMVSELMGLWDWEGEHRTMWALLSARIRRQQKRRNELAHFRFVSFGAPVGEQSKLAVVPYHTQAAAASGNLKRLYAPEIWQRNERFRQLVIAVDRFSKTARQTPLKRIKSPEISPELIDLLRKQIVQNLDEDEMGT